VPHLDLIGFSTPSSTGAIGTNKTMAPTLEIFRPTTPFPTEPLYKPNEYDEAPDFADWDDFFESKPL